MELVAIKHSFPLPTAFAPMALGDIDTCGLRADCGACARDPDCGWDAERNVCLRGDARGDVCRTSAPCAWFSDACPTAASCRAKPLNCGWCTTKRRCRHGDALGPFVGWCDDDWAFAAV